MLLFRYRAIVDKSFHSVLEWSSRQKLFLTFKEPARKKGMALQVARTQNLILTSWIFRLWMTGTEST